MICCHKNYYLPENQNNIFLPIHAGKSISTQKLNIQTDNEINNQPCDNISEKNAYYCELTAIYWAWKNIKTLYPNIKYIGLFHYRRFLAFNERKYFCDNITKNSKEILNYTINPQKIINILENSKIILPNYINFCSSLQIQYCLCCLSTDYNQAKKVVHDEFPDYYDSFIDVMEKNNHLHPCNMFVMKYDDFEKYCEWLFAVLASLENKIPYKNYDNYQRRVFGFLAERLLNVYVHKNKMKSRNFNLLMFDDNMKTVKKNIMHKILGYIHRFIAYKKADFIMFLNNFSLLRMIQRQ